MAQGRRVTSTGAETVPALGDRRLGRGRACSAVAQRHWRVGSAGPRLRVQPPPRADVLVSRAPGRANWQGSRVFRRNVKPAGSVLMQSRCRVAEWRSLRYENHVDHGTKTVDSDDLCTKALRACSHFVHSYH